MDEDDGWLATGDSIDRSGLCESVWADAHDATDDDSSEGNEGNKGFHDIDYRHGMLIVQSIKMMLLINMRDIQFVVSLTKWC